MIKAVIDVGTNSTRLYIADISEKKQKCLKKMLATTRLGEGIAQANKIKKEPMERTCRQIAEFVNIAKAGGAAEIYIYATAVVREASNRGDFSAAVKSVCGITPDIISGELEGKIAYMGASAGYNNCGVIDIGGGSTEVVTCFDNNLTALSEKIGGVRLKEMFECGEGQIDTEKVKAYVIENFIGNYDAVTGISKTENLIGVSGTPTTLASLSLGVKEYRPEKIQGMYLKKEEICFETEKLAKMSGEERRVYSGEFAPRADIIVYGGCILSAFIEYYNFGGVVVSDRDSLEGYLEYKTGIK